MKEKGRKETGDERFIRKLRESRASQEATGRFLSSKGWPVILEPTFIRPDVNDRDHYADNADVRVIMSVEAKHRPDLDFRKKSDYNWPSIIVDMCSSWDKKHPKPIYVFIWNKSLTAFFLVDVHRTRHTWVKKYLTRSKEKTSNWFYCVDVKLCKFVNIEK